MDGQWPQENSGVHTDLDLAIASPNDYNLMLQELGADLDGMLGLGANTNIGNIADDASAAAVELDNNGNQRRVGWNRKRHNKDQVEQLEAAFREIQHPDDKQRREIAMRLGITEKQVKFWFQNRRSAIKTQEQRKDTDGLKEENEALKAEQRALRFAAENKTCLTCGGPTLRVGGTPRQQELLAENTRLREAHQRVSAFLHTVSGGRGPELMASAMPSGSHGHATHRNAWAGKGKALATDDHAPPPSSHQGGSARSQPDTSSILVNLANYAMTEFRTLVYSGTPMWMPTPHGQVELLNLQNYIETISPSIFGPYRMGAVVDGTRKTGDVLCTVDNLVNVLMNAVDWSGMFPGIVASASASVIVPPGDSRHGMTILMDAELRVLSPGVAPRKVKFVRHCRDVGPGTWAVVDVSVDGILGLDGSGVPPTYTPSRFLPSGCLIKGRSSGCKVTWIVNMEHDETTVSPTYHPLLRSGHALGACHWLASLQRQYQYLAIMHSLGNTNNMMPNGRTIILEVAQRMTRSFYEAMCGPWSQPSRSVLHWSGGCGVGTERFEVVARVVTYSAGNGAHVLNATAPVWLPGIPAQQVFDYICDGSRRGEWDSLANGAPIRQEGYFATAHLPGNSVSVHRTTASDGTNGKLILQEACADTTCMVLAYAVIDEEAMQHAMNNGGTASLSLLPSGLIILPDGKSPISDGSSSSTAVNDVRNAGSLVSVMYQTLMTGEAEDNPSLETIDDAGNLLCRVIKKIKDAARPCQQR